MSKKKKHKKNNKSHVQGGGVVNQSSNLNINEVKEEQKLLTADEELAKLENKPVDFLSAGVTSTSETKSEINMSGEDSTLKMDFTAEADKVENKISEQESKLKQDLEREAHITLESEAEHSSHVNKSPKSFVPFWTGIIVGALLTYLFL